MTSSQHKPSRRLFLSAAAALAGGAGLAGCGPDPSSASHLKFWNMPWGGPTYEPLDSKIVTSYTPKDGVPPVTYQQIQWTSFTMTFATAIASKTGPAVSAGGGTQAFEFAEQGAIAYADDLLDSWRAEGLLDDFLPGVLDTMKTPAGYVAVPYNLDMRALWYNHDLLEKAGTEPPTDWQSYLDAAAALQKIGVYAFPASGNANGGNAFQMLIGILISNGGGIFDKDQEPDLLTDANVEAIEFVDELIAKGYMPPGSISFTSTNENTLWQQQKVGLGFGGPGLPANVPGEASKKLRVADPLVGARGASGALYFPNNIMMYTNTPSQEGSEAFMTYYYKNMAPLWTETTGIGLPVLRSIVETDEFQADANQVKLVEKWQPICKTWAAPGGDALFAKVTTVDSTPAITKFGQDVLNRKAPREALGDLQKALRAQTRT